MPIIQQLLFRVPPYLLGPIVVGTFTLFSVAGLLIVRHFVPHSRLKTHHDVADPILGAVSAVYAVLIAFIVVTVWQSYDKSNSNVEMEANYMADIYRDAEAFSPDFKQKVDVLLREYRKAIVCDEWKTMAKGQMSPKAEETIRQIWTLYTTYQPRNPTEQSFFDESVQKLNSFRELRRQRLMDSRAGIAPLLWFVLIGGALATISFTFLFGAENIKAQIIMVVILSVLISLILFTIMELDYPFTGSASISSAPFKGMSLD
jgi:hypothetical protein